MTAQHISDLERARRAAILVVQIAHLNTRFADTKVLSRLALYRRGWQREIRFPKIAAGRDDGADCDGLRKLWLNGGD